MKNPGRVASPFRSWAFWGGITAGIGAGLILGAGFVESFPGVTWPKYLTFAVFLAGMYMAGLGGRAGRDAAQPECERRSS